MLRVRLQWVWFLVQIVFQLGQCSQVTDDAEFKHQEGESIFGDDFYDTFNEMEQQDLFYDQIEAGFDNWEERCVSVGGEHVLDEWLKAQENLVFCVLQHFDIATIQKEIEIKKDKGELDLVFKKYCDAPVKQTRPCIENFLKASRKCLRSEDRRGLNVTLRMIDKAIEFVCHNNGDRLALFMSEDGFSCLQDHQQPIANCVNRTVPEVFHMNNHKNVDLIVFNHRNCRKGEAIRRCVETELLKCPDPTPSNVINSMMLAMRRATPCQSMLHSRLASASSLRSAGSLHLVVTSLLLKLVIGTK